MGIQNPKIRRDKPVEKALRTILHVIDALNYGGAQKLLVLLAKWTPKNAYKTIICSLQTNKETLEEIESKGVQVFCFNRLRPSIFSPHLLSAYIYRNVKDIIRICEREKVDVIQCHLSDSEFIGILAGHLFGVERMISTIHYPDLLPKRRSGDLRNLLRLLATKMIYRWTDYIIAVSDDVAEQLRDVFGLKERKIRVIVNRIDVESLWKTSVSEQLRTSLGLSRENRVITTVARLMPPKGHQYLIEAIYKLIQKFPDLRLILVGDGDLKERLRAQCEILGLTNHVLFLGSRQDVPHILALTDIFVLPSLWEGTSLALLEAMAMGKPIVATDIPGNSAVLEHKTNAYLVSSADADALSEAISFLLENPDLALEYGKKAQKVAKDHFDIRQTIAELERLWNK